MAVALDILTLDQIRVFLCVVDTGSFSAAARQMHRAQSAISYAVANLEGALGAPLFDRSGHKPVLTDFGTALVREARAVEARVSQLAARATALTEGTEAQVSIAVDGLYPMALLTDTLRDFQQEYPGVPLNLRTENLGAVAQLVLEGTCQVGVSGMLENFPPTLDKRRIVEISMVPVVAPSHPLGKREGSIPTPIFEEHTQIVVSDRSSLTQGIDRGVLSGHTWRVADLATKHELLRAGFGWGGMPEHVIKTDLRDRRLVVIQPEEFGHGGYHVPLYAVTRADDPPGPASRWLIQRLADACD